MEEVKKLPRGSQGFEKEKVQAEEVLRGIQVKLKLGGRGRVSIDEAGTKLLFGPILDLDLAVAVRLEGVLHDKFPEIYLLSGLTQKPLQEVELILERYDISCPLALKMFCLGYEKHRAELERTIEPTQPAPLTCTV